MANKKITGSVMLTLVGVVSEVSFLNGGHCKHSLGYVKVAEGDDKKYQNWQVMTFSSEGKETRTFPEGTVLQVSFRSFQIFTSQNGGVYLTPDFPDIQVVKWGDKEQGAEGDQPSTYNRPSKPSSSAPVVESDEDF